jgi:hypothetical protein
MPGIIRRTSFFSCFRSYAPHHFPPPPPTVPIPQDRAGAGKIDPCKLSPVWLTEPAYQTFSGPLFSGTRKQIELDQKRYNEPGFLPVKRPDGFSERRRLQKTLIASIGCGNGSLTLPGMERWGRSCDPEARNTGWSLNRPENFKFFPKKFRKNPPEFSYWLPALLKKIPDPAISRPVKKSPAFSHNRNPARALQVRSPHKKSYMHWLSEHFSPAGQAFPQVPQLLSEKRSSVSQPSDICVLQSP